jgi:hypothetical protein
MTHQLHHEIESVLTEAKGLPKGTELSGPLKLSSWGGKLALVDTPSMGGFDPDKQEREYAVNYALDLHTRKPFKAVPLFVGKEPHFRDRNKPFHKTVFTVGTPGYGNYLEGTFAPVERVRVPLGLRQMTPGEHRDFIGTLKRDGYTDISDSGLSLAKLKKLLPMDFTDIQDKADWQDANLVDRLLDKRLGVDTTSDGAANSAWEKLGKKGVYAVSRRGEVKFFWRRR